MDVEFIKEAIPKRSKGKYMSALQEWEESDNKTIVFKFATFKERTSCYNVIRKWIKKENKDYTIFMKQTSVYVVRA